MASYVGRWSEAQIEVARVMYQQGLSLGEMASELGRSRSAMAGFANRNRALFPPRNEHHYRTLTETAPLPPPPKPKPPQPQPQRNPRVTARGLKSSVLIDVAVRPSVARVTPHIELSKDQLRAMLHAAVLNTR